MGKKGKRKRRRETIDGLEESDDGGASPPAAAARSARGPPVATTSGRLSGSVPNDEWQTTRSSWAAVADLFVAWRHKRIWMPFYYDGECARHLRALGFTDVVHDDVDFFERVKDGSFMRTVDLIWDNPPYTTAETKERVLRALAACGKPFAMLLPISILHVAFVRDIVDMNDGVQVIIPRRVHVRKIEGSPLPFKYLVWFCVHARLPQDLIFVDDDDEPPPAGGGGAANSPLVSADAEKPALPRRGPTQPVASEGSAHGNRRQR